MPPLLDGIIYFQEKIDILINIEKCERETEEELYLQVVYRRDNMSTKVGFKVFKKFYFLLYSTIGGGGERVCVSYRVCKKLD